MYNEVGEASYRSINQNEEIYNQMRILIVDDEPKILRGMSLMIGKMNKPSTSLLCASGAEDALNAVQSFCPDVVITDICMPNIDGFELIDRLKELSSCKRYIILSGYSDFEYARKAIKKKAMDYLLKPVDEDALQQLLLRVESELLQDKQNNRSFIVYTLKDLIFYGAPLSKSFLDKQFDGIFPFPNFLLTIFRYKNHLHEDIQQALKQPFYNYTSKVELIKHPNRRLIVVLANLPANFIKADRKVLYEGFKHIIGNNYYKQLYFGMSGLSSDILQLNKLYHSAMRDSFIVQLFPDKCFEEQKRIGYCLEHLIGKIDSILENGSLPDTHEVFASFMEELEHILRTDDDWDNLYSVIITCMKNSVNKREYTLKEAPLMAEISWKDQYGACSSEKISKAIYRILSSILNNQQCNMKYKNKLKREMQEFIHSHYMDNNISLADLANYVNMHPKYVSTIFSKYTGMTFRQYLNHYRISRAKNIMAEYPDITQESIALMVGYENQRNYYKVFKRICHCTPSEYRKRL